MIPYPWVYHFGDKDKIIGVVVEIDGLRGINVAFFIFIGFISPSKTFKKLFPHLKKLSCNFYENHLYHQVFQFFLHLFYLLVSILCTWSHNWSFSVFNKLFNCSVEIYLHLVLFILLVKCKGLEAFICFPP